jgi:hypothetical protein
VAAGDVAAVFHSTEYVYKSLFFENEVQEALESRRIYSFSGSGCELLRFE